MNRYHVSKMASIWAAFGAKIIEMVKNNQLNQTDLVYKESFEDWCTTDVPELSAALVEDQQMISSAKSRSASALR